MPTQAYEVFIHFSAGQSIKLLMHQLLVILSELHLVTSLIIESTKKSIKAITTMGSSQHLNFFLFPVFKTRFWLFAFALSHQLVTQRSVVFNFFALLFFLLAA